VQHLEVVSGKERWNCRNRLTRLVSIYHHKRV